MADDVPPQVPVSKLESIEFDGGRIVLYRRSDLKKAIWQARIRVDGVAGYIRRTTKHTTEHAAYGVARDIYNRASAKVHSGQSINSQRVTEALKTYQTAMEAQPPTRYFKDKVLFAKRISPFFKSTRMAEIDTAAISRLVTWMHEIAPKGRLAPNSVKRRLADLKHFLQWGFDQGLIAEMPRFPKQVAESNRRPHFDSHDWSVLTRHLREFVKHPKKSIVRDRTMLVNYVLILANTGIRVGEARTLKWRDLSQVAAADPTAAPNMVLYVRGKTDAREVVARTSDVKTYFTRLLELRTAELGREPDSDGYIFCGRNGKPIGSFKTSFNSLLKSAGVEFDSNGDVRTIYSLRHTYATFRLHEHVNHYALAQNMGTSVAMIEKFYGHTSNVMAAAELTKNSKWADRSAPASPLAWLARVALATQNGSECRPTAKASRHKLNFSVRRAS